MSTFGASCRQCTAARGMQGDDKKVGGGEEGLETVNFVDILLSRHHKRKNPVTPATNLSRLAAHFVLSVKSFVDQFG